MENNSNKRVGEEKESPYRSGRFYTIANEWFFCVREKEDQGPYISKDLAEKGLKNYLMDKAHFNSKEIKLN